MRPFIALAACLAAFVIPSAAAIAAESPDPPRHLVAYHLAWLSHLAPEDIPANPPAICIVDSGVAITPDTPADNPAGPIVARLSTDGGSGEPQGTAPEQLHGTKMAMSAIAAKNDWGTIGVAPWLRVISVRAMINNETTLRSDAYRHGMNQCLSASQFSGQRVAAISLSLGTDGAISDDEQAAIADLVTAAHMRGISVLAAAGNQGGTTQAPASLPGVIAVAAGAADGALAATPALTNKLI